MINFESFSDELAKIAEGGYRHVTPWEQWMLPEGVIGSVIPLDPEERAEEYRKASRFAVPMSAVSGGLLGGTLGYGIHPHGSPIGGAIGLGLGALAMGGGTELLRRHMAKRIRERAMIEAASRQQNSPQVV